MNLYIVCILILIHPLQLLSLHRLTTKSNNKLNPIDYIYSTLGTFRFTLTTTTCQLRIQQFSGSFYKFRGNFPQQIFKFSCKYIYVDNGILLTEHEVPLLKVHDLENKRFDETTLTIDDLGIIRLTCFTNKSQNSTQSQQVWITKFRTPHRFIYPTSETTIQSDDSLSLVINQASWGFSALNGQLRIFHTEDPTKILRYPYNQFSISPGTITDENNLQPPAATFKLFNYQPKCATVNYLNFQYPLVFVISRNWPQLRLVDQGGYELLSIRYPYYNCISDLNITSIEGQSECISWFCPQGTFEYQGSCILQCPYPYYHSIKANNKNKCVLMCEEGATKNQEDRVCTCGKPYTPIQCLAPAQSYSLGCYCQNNKYYNGFTCSTLCPIGYINLSLVSSYVYTNKSSQAESINSNINNVYGYSSKIYGGVCIKCPYKCLQCSIYKGKYQTMFLVCNKCMEGYSVLEREGVCRKLCKDDCNINVDLNFNDKNASNGSINRVVTNSTEECSIQKCQQCEFDCSNKTNDLPTSAKSGTSLPSPTKYTKQTCLQCSRPFVLYKNACIKQCPQGFILKATPNFHFTCDKIPNCQLLPPNKNSHPSTSSAVQNQCQSCKNLSDRCWIDCQHKSFFNNRSAFYCVTGVDNNGEPLYGHTQNSRLPNQSHNHNSSASQDPSFANWLKCPLTQYLYTPTQQCLPCPFGCITCMHDALGYIQCTSCAPSYFLYLDLNFSHYCQRDTSLISCESNLSNQKGFEYLRVYDAVNKVCGYGNIKNSITQKINNFIPYTSPIYNSKIQRIRCKKLIPNCLICQKNSASACSFCSQGYNLNVQNYTCQPICSNSTLLYNKVCIPNVIHNCLLPTLTEKFYLVNVTEDSIQLNGYKYFINTAFDEFSKTIDPIGNIFALTNMFFISTSPRTSIFPNAQLVCQKCKQFYGINPYTNLCQPCIQSTQCIYCMSSLQTRCFQCASNYKIDGSTGRCIQKREKQKKCTKGQWRNQSGICVSSCKYGFKMVNIDDNSTLQNQSNSNAYTVNCSRYCNSNHGIGIYSRIEVDPNNSSQSLLCIKQKRKQKPKQNSNNKLLMTGTVYKLHQNYIMLVLSPLQSIFTTDIFDNNNNIDAANYVQIYVTNSITHTINSSTNKSLDPTEDQYNELDITNNSQIIYSNIESDRIVIISKANLLSSYNVVGVRLNVGELYGEQGKTKKTNWNKGGKLLKKLSATPHQGSNSQDQLLFLSQSQYMFTLSSPPYSFHLTSSLSPSFFSYFAIILTLLLTVFYFGLSIDYKTDNLIILLQTLALFFLSIDIRLLQTNFYEILYGFRWIVGKFSSNSSNYLGESMINRLIPLDPYVEIAQSTSQLLLIKDTNVIRNCAPLFIITILFILFYIVIGLLFMKMQLFCWNRVPYEMQFISKQNWNSLQNNKQQQTKINKKIIINEKKNEYGSTNRKLIKQQNYQQNQQNQQNYKYQIYQTQTVLGKYQLNNKSIQNKQINHNQKYSIYYQSKKQIKNKKTNFQKNGKQQSTNHNKKLTNNEQINTPITSINNLSNLQNNSKQLPQKTTNQNILKKITNYFDNIIYTNKMYKYNPIDIDHSKKLQLACTFIFQNSSMVFMYFSLLTLLTTPILLPNLPANYQINNNINRVSSISKAISIIIIIIISIYTLYKLRVNRISGIYMLKRISLSIILALIMGNSSTFIFAIIIESIFMFIRIFIEQLTFIVYEQKNKQENSTKNNKQQNIDPIKQSKLQITTNSNTLNKKYNNNIIQKNNISLEIQNNNKNNYKKQSNKNNTSKNNQIQMIPINEKQKNHSHPNQSKTTNNQIIAVSNQNTNKNSTNKSNTHNKSQNTSNINEKTHREDDKKIANQKNTSSLTFKTCYIKYILTPIHRLKPFARIISLLFEQLLLIILYIFLSFTDTFTFYANKYHNHPQIIHIGILITIILIIIIISIYLFTFILQIIQILFQSYKMKGMTEKQKKNISKFSKINKMQSYYKQKQQIMEFQTGYPSIPANLLDNNNKKNYIQIFNQFTYKNFNNYHSFEDQNSKYDIQMDFKINKYSNDRSIYEYIY